MFHWVLNTPLTLHFRFTRGFKNKIKRTQFQNIMSVIVVSHDTKKSLTENFIFCVVSPLLGNPSPSELVH